jgi:hypothetical protein
LVSFGSADAATTQSLAEACSLAFASLYAGLLGVLDHQVPDYWSFTICDLHM